MRLSFAFEQMGLSAGDAQKAVQNAARATVEAGRGSATYVEALNNIGLEYSVLANQSPRDPVLGDIGCVEEHGERGAAYARGAVVAGSFGSGVGHCDSWWFGGDKPLGGRSSPPLLARWTMMRSPRLSASTMPLIWGLALWRLGLSMRSGGWLMS